MKYAPFRGFDPITLEPNSFKRRNNFTRKYAKHKSGIRGTSRRDSGRLGAAKPENWSAKIFDNPTCSSEGTGADRMIDPEKIIEDELNKIKETNDEKDQG